MAEREKEKIIMNSRQQRAQEEEYYFPYHYLDLVPRIQYCYIINTRHRRFVTHLLKPFVGQRVLDAGCGDGRLCYEMRQYYLDVTGVDYSERALSFAKAFCPGVPFILADVTEYTSEKTFDAIIMLEVIEHLQPKLIPKMLTNLSQNLSEKGKAIFSVPSTKIKISSKHYQHFTKASLRSILEPHFNVEKIIGFMRSGARFWLCTKMIKWDLLLGSLKFRRRGPVWPFYWAVDKLLDSIEQCDPHHAQHLIAICRKV